MKAMVLESPAAPFVLRQLPDPAPGPDEAVARVTSCGCGLTVQHARAGRIPIEYPRILGHEICAEICAVGGDVSELAVGDAVTAYFYLTCGHCSWCRIDRETLCENFRGYVGRDIDGGYAEYVKLPASSFIKLPEGLNSTEHPAEIGVVTDAVATPFKVIRRARVEPNDTVVVFGAGGGLGIHMLMLARFAHARAIAVDTRPEKFDACLRAGAEHVLDAGSDDVVQALEALTRGRGVDVAVDFVSSTETLETALAALGRGGRLVTLGGSGQPFTAHAKTLLLKELEILGSRYVTKQEVIDSLELVARGKLWPLVTEVCKLEDVEALHQRIEQGLVTGRAALLIE